MNEIWIKHKKSDTKISMLLSDLNMTGKIRVETFSVPILMSQKKRRFRRFASELLEGSHSIFYSFDAFQSNKEKIVEHSRLSFFEY